MRLYLKLIKYSNTEWGVISNEGTVRGTLKKAVQKLISLGVSFESFSEAVESLEQNNHNVADFGIIQKIFLYSNSVDLAQGGFTPVHAVMPQGNA